MSAAGPKILLRDDGALEEVRTILDDLGVDWMDGTKERPDLLPSRMLITSGSCAAEAQNQIQRGRSERNILHLVIVDRASRSLRSMLKRAGCDMVALRPVHPTVVRLLVQRALYPGEERRVADRVAIGAPVKIKSGMRAQGATLSELSMRGCGLITRSTLSVGAGLKVMIPSEIAEGGPLNLAGQVVGAKHDLSLEAGQHSAAVEFRSLTRRDSRALEAIMSSHSVGRTGQLHRPLGLVDEPPVASPARITSAAPAPAAADRRATPRGQYSESVLARAPGETHSLLGCDLSIGGMRVAPDPSLRMGAKLQLGVFGQGGVRPVIVAATVVRDGGDDGFGLRFDPLPGKAQVRLKRIVDSLEHLDDSESSTATVVSEVIESD